MSAIPRIQTGETSDYLSFHSGPSAPTTAHLPTSGSSMVWHNTTLDEIQVWANVAGTLKQLSGGGGGVSGSGVSGQVAFWTGSSSIGGDTGLTYSATTPKTLTVGGRVLVADGSSGTPSIAFSTLSSMGFFRQPTGDSGADAFRITWKSGSDRAEFRFQTGATSSPQRPATWLILPSQTDIWFTGSTDLPSSSPPSTGLVALTSFSTNTLDIHNYGSTTAYRDTKIRLNRRGRDLNGSDAFISIGFTSTSSTNANTEFRVVNAGATAADFQFVIPGLIGARYLFTIGSTYTLILNGDGGHEIEGSGYPNRTGICAINAGGPPFGRIALATFAHGINGVSNICRYGVAYSESAISSGCQFKSRVSGTGVSPVAADLPEEGEWALWKTVTDGLHSIVIRDSGVLTYVGGRRRVLQAADLTTSSTTPVATDLSVNLLSGGLYFIKCVLHVNTSATGSLFGFKVGISGTVAGTFRIAAVHAANDDIELFRFTGLGDASFNSDTSTIHVVLMYGTVSVTTTGSFTITFGSLNTANSATLFQHSFLEISR